MLKAGLGRWYSLAALVMLLDQLSKLTVLATLNYGDTVTVTSFFNWVFVFNRGAAFSFLAWADGWQRWFFTALALAVSVWIGFMLNRHRGESLLCGALALIMGGALGNVIDRLRFGAVVVSSSSTRPAGTGRPSTWPTRPSPWGQCCWCGSKWAPSLSKENRIRPFPERKLRHEP